jgi:hypothetical protein
MPSHSIRRFIVRITSLCLLICLLGRHVSIRKFNVLLKQFLAQTVVMVLNALDELHYLMVPDLSVGGMYNPKFEFVLSSLITD